MNTNRKTRTGLLESPTAVAASESAFRAEPVEFGFGGALTRRRRFLPGATATRESGMATVARAPWPVAARGFRVGPRALRLTAPLVLGIIAMIAGPLASSAVAQCNFGGCCEMYASNSTVVPGQTITVLLRGGANPIAGCSQYLTGAMRGTITGSGLAAALPISAISNQASLGFWGANVGSVGTVMAAPLRIVGQDCTRACNPGGPGSLFGGCPPQSSADNIYVFDVTIPLGAVPGQYTFTYTGQAFWIDNWVNTGGNLYCPVLSPGVNISGCSVTITVGLPQCSDFDSPTTLQGWTTLAATATNTAGGPSGNYVFVQDQSGGSRFFNPTTFSGDWNQLLAGKCGTLEYDVRLVDDGLAGSSPHQPYVVIRGSYPTPNLVFTPNLTVVEGGPWVHVVAPLNLIAPPTTTLGTWTVNGGSWQTTLAGVSELEMRLELGNGNEIWNYDNICLNDVPCPCTSPPLDMVAWWPLDEQDGATVVQDIAGGNHPGTPSPGPVGTVSSATEGPASTVSWPPVVAAGGGKVDDGMYFWSQHQNRYVQVPDDPRLDLGTTDLTIDAWVFITQYSGGAIQPIVEKMEYIGTAPFTGYRLYLDSGVPTFEVANSGSLLTFTSTPQLTQGAWHFLAVTVDRANGVVDIYLDIYQRLTITSVPNFGDISSPADLFIGGSSLGPSLNYLDVGIDEVEIFDRALTSDELLAVFSADSAGKCKCVPRPQGMVAWYTGDDTTPIDHLGQHDGTFVGFPISSSDSKVGGGALETHAPNTYVTVPGGTGPGSLNFGTGDFSIDMWVKTTANAGVQTLIDKRVASAPGAVGVVGYAVYLVNGTLSVQLADPNFGHYNYNSGLLVADGTWHFVAVIVDRDDPGGPKMYVDGSVAPPFIPTNRQGNLDNPAPLLIGAHAFGGGVFTGLLDEIEFFNRALTPDEVDAIRLADVRGKCKGSQIGSCCDRSADTCLDAVSESECTAIDRENVCETNSDCTSDPLRPCCIDDPSTSNPVLRFCGKCDFWWSSELLCADVTCGCSDDVDCDDDDVCTFDDCDGGTCTSEPNQYGDLDHNGTISLFDLFCTLNAFADNFSDPCTMERVDIDPCIPNGTINLGDLFAVLNAFGDADPCCGGSSPSQPGSDELSVSRSVPHSGVLSFVPSLSEPAAGESISLDVYVNGVEDLRGYQLALNIDGGEEGQLIIESMSVDTSRQDFVFNSSDDAIVNDRNGLTIRRDRWQQKSRTERSQSVHGIAEELTEATDLLADNEIIGADGETLTSFDATRSRLLAVTMNEGVQSRGAAYLATFILRATPDASGLFKIYPQMEETSLVDSEGQPIKFGERTHVTLMVR